MTKTKQADLILKDLEKKTEEIYAKPQEETSQSAEELLQVIAQLQSELQAKTWLPHHSLISVGLILILCICVLIFLFHLTRENPDNADGLLRIGAVPLIVVSSVILIVVGFDEKQVAPAFALMGTLVGYLLPRGNQGGAPNAPAATPTDQNPPVPASPQPPHKE